MNYYDIMKKRKHVRDYYMNIIPPKKDIEEILQKAYELTPSKQNAIPYEVSVLGPDKQDDKDKIYDRVVGNHKFMEKYGFLHNLSVLDLIFNLGPNSSAYLDELVIDI